MNKDGMLRTVGVMLATCTRWLHALNHNMNCSRNEIPQVVISTLLVHRKLCNKPSSSSAGTQSSSFMVRYEAILLQRFPRAHAVHRMVIDGCKWCWSDIKTYFLLKRDLSNNTRQLAELRSRELEILLQCPAEVMHIIGLLVLLQIPVVGESLCVILVLFPRFILTRHFWTDDQRKMFWSANLKRSFQMHVGPLQKNLQNMNINLQTPLGKMKELELPEMNTFSLVHLYHLSRLHRVSLLTGARGLSAHAEALRYLDQALKMESATIDEMGEQQLYQQFYLRRLQYEGLSEEAMKCVLKNWVQHMSDPNLKISVYLHVPVFKLTVQECVEN